MRVVIFTGSETRHTYFRLRVASDGDIDVLRTFCESDALSLENRLSGSSSVNEIQRQHIAARKQSEQDFFADFIRSTEDTSNKVAIAKGSINDADIVSETLDLNPDLIVCFGSSLIKSELLEIYKGRFLNVHLGLAPYYRGSGTNVWPLIDGLPEYVGATFMHIDSGIDTGDIIHQIRAEYFLGDSPSTIGNRLIKRMVDLYCQIIKKIDYLEPQKQILADGRLIKRRDFDEVACKTLYANCNDDTFFRYCNRRERKQFPRIVSNPMFETE